MTDLTTPVTADWLWQMAGPDMWLYKWSAEGCAMLQGKGARCMMTRLEFAKYQEMRRQHAETRTAPSYREQAIAGKRRQMARRHELAGAPVVSMMVVESEEEARRIAEERLAPHPAILCPHCKSGLLWSEDRGPHCDGCDDFDPEKDLTGMARTSDFARSFREIEQCLIAHARCLSDDERDEIIRQIAAKIMPLKEAVLRAEEIWQEDHAPVTVNGHQLSRLDEIIEPDTNEELQLTNRGGCLVATIKAEDHEAEWLLDQQGKFSTEGGVA